MKLLILTIAVISIFAGCSVKEFNEGVDSITSDIANTFEEGKDK